MIKRDKFGRFLKGHPSRLGTKASLETRRKLSIARRKRKTKQSTLIKMSKSMMGHPVSQETREKIRLSRLKEKCPMWKGGISPYYYQKIAKDNLIQKCSLCGSIKFLCCHHKNRNRKDNRLENLMIVCKRCHQNIHIGRNKK